MLLMYCYFVTEKYWEMNSFSESQALKLAMSCPEEFVNHNKRFLSRIYPNGMRVDSTNYNPQDLWNCGCQMGKQTYPHPASHDQHTRQSKLPTSTPDSPTYQPAHQTVQPTNQHTRQSNLPTSTPDNPTYQPNGGSHAWISEHSASQIWRWIRLSSPEF